MLGRGAGTAQMSESGCDAEGGTGVRVVVVCLGFVEAGGVGLVDVGVVGLQGMGGCDSGCVCRLRGSRFLG